MAEPLTTEEATEAAEQALAQARDADMNMTLRNALVTTSERVTRERFDFIPNGSRTEEHATEQVFQCAMDLK